MTGPLHPELDALSAALDGQDDAAATHAATCATCGAEMDRLRTVQQLVASDPRPLPDDVIDGLVSAAVRSSTITPFSSARRRGPLRPPVGWMAAAAAAIAIVVGLPALLGGLGGLGSADNDMLAKTGDEAAESADSLDADSGLDAGGGGGGEGAGVATADGSTAASGATSASALSYGDLGDHSDPAALAAAIASTTPGTSRQAAAEESAPPAAPGPPACESPTRAIGAGRLARLVYAGSVRWRGERAEVLAFELAPREGVRSGERQLYVLRPQGCSVLAEQRF